MKSDREISVARALIQRHGMRASAVAMEHAVQSEAQSDCEAGTNWRVVARLVDELRREQRAA